MCSPFSLLNMEKLVDLQPQEFQSFLTSRDKLLNQKGESSFKKHLSQFKCKKSDQIERQALLTCSLVLV